MKEKRIWQINDGEVVKESLWIRIKCLFGWKPKSVRENLRERFNRVRGLSDNRYTRTNEEMDKVMENIINKTKRVPYINEQTGDYNLRFNLQNMLEETTVPVRESSLLGKITETKVDDVAREYMISKFQKLPGIKKETL